jgi:hypothetical protein
LHALAGQWQNALLTLCTGNAVSKAAGEFMPSFPSWSGSGRFLPIESFNVIEHASGRFQHAYAGEARDLAQPVR